MDRLLKPDKLDVDPNSSTAAEEWKHWRVTFEYFLAALPSGSVNARALLVNHVSPRVFASIADTRTYEEAMQSLKEMYEKPVNEVLARHRLASRRQQHGETIDEYVRALRTLCAQCNLQAVSAARYQEELVRDAFVCGLQSQVIRQRLLESKNCDLTSLLDMARVLESAQKCSDEYVTAPALDATVTLAAADGHQSESTNNCEESCNATGAVKRRCFFCGQRWHARSRCPASDVNCWKCNKKGHFGKMCRSKLAAQLNSVSLADSRSTFPIAGCSPYLVEGIVSTLRLRTFRSRTSVAMASSSTAVTSLGHTITDLLLKGRLYKNDFQRRHKSLVLEYGGSLPPLAFSCLTTLMADPPRLFAHLTPDCHPVATKSRRFSREDSSFIRNEVQRLLKEGIIEPSDSPWRAQITRKP
uniref:CCHC-type domain-containing protein n=1 Tax=Trichuris muris TaxID=70415 RepID=A0A5S6R1M3_TRIMR